MKSELARLIEAAVKARFDIKVEAEIEYAPEGKGDFASNVAFRIAKQTGKNPNEVASELANELRGPNIDKVTPEGPYLNILLEEKYWLLNLQQLDEKYGSDSAGAGKKVQVEFISANPTGPLTIGNARGGFLGDVLSNVIVSQGYEVTREYYFNDAGTQVMKLVDSARIAAGLKEGEPEYKGAYLEELAKEFKDVLEKPDMEAAKVLTGAISQRFIEPAIKKMGIKMDHWFNERDLIEKGSYETIETALLDKGNAEKKDGAVWALSTKYGDERDRVLRKSNGDVSYLGTDLAYHRNIFEERGFDRAIKVLGADHSGQTLSIKVMVEGALKLKGNLDFLIYQFVRLVKEGKEVKIGKRIGTYVTTDELIDEVGSDVARFFFLMRSPDSHMDFDLGLAKEQSQKNPYWYVMYAYVRGNSILKQAKQKGMKLGNKLSALTEKEKQIIKHISRWPDLLDSIVEDFSVHQLTFFGQDLAKLFHDYYETEKIIGLPDREASEKLYFVQQICSFFEVYFSVLGIKPLDKM